MVRVPWKLLEDAANAAASGREATNLINALNALFKAANEARNPSYTDDEGRTYYDRAW